MDAEARAPGWYPDPWGGDGERYFDGTSWSRDANRTPTAPPPRSGRRPLMWMLGGLVAAVVVAAILFITVGNDTDSSHVKGAAAPSSTASTTTTRPHFVLKSYDPGDCATWDQSKPNDVAHIVDCSEPHLMEIVASKNINKLFDHYPSEGEWRVVDATVCKPLVEQYLKTPIDPHGRYYAGAIRPIEDSWERGDHHVDCGITLSQTLGPDEQLVPFSGKVDPHAQYIAFAPGTCLPPTPDHRLGDPVPCTQPHIVEISGSVDLTGRVDHAPSDDEMDALVGDDCERMARDYLGHPLADGIRAGWLTIDPAGWAANHRVTECTIARYDGDTEVTVTAPLKGG